MKTCKHLIFGLIVLIIISTIFSACGGISEASGITALYAPRLQLSGNVLTWNNDNGAIGYKISIGGTELAVDVNYCLLTGLESGSNKLKVKVLADGIKNINSGWSSVFSYQAPSFTPTSGLEYSLINGGTAYEVAIGTAADAEIAIPAKYLGLPVTAIAANGFANSPGITGITIPASVSVIGNYAFEGCSNLTNIDLPSGVASIGNSVFRNCSSLALITFNAINIGQNAFQGCSSLNTIYYGRSTWSGTTVNSTGNTKLTNTARFYYSEKKPAASGLFWHWANGVQTVWN